MFKKNQKNRAFIAAIAMLLLSAIVITTASFAWFTLGRSAMASNLDLKVTKQGEGIQISANATSFTEEITFNELNGTDTESAYVAPSKTFNYFPAEISPTSTSMSLANGLPVFFTGGIDNGSRTMESFASTSENGVDIYGKEGVTIPDTLKGKVKNAGFYAFDVFIEYTGGAEAQVKVGSTTIAVKDNSDVNQALEEAANAMRIGFVNCGTVEKNSTPVAATSGSEAVIFATNEEARNTNPITSTGVSGAIADGSYTVPQSAAGTLNIADFYDCGMDTAGNDQTITVKSGVNQIRVYVWMEGQDANCTDKLQSQLISANLVFTMV